MLKRVWSSAVVTLALLLSLLTSDAAGEPIGIHFVASAFSLKSDTAENNNFSYQASKAKWDVYLPGVVNDNGFVSIDGNRVKVRSLGGSKAYRTKNGVGNCDGDFSTIDPAQKPSSVIPVRKVGNTAYIKIGNPISYLNLFQDHTASSLCSQPDFGIFATLLDGSSPPGSTIKNKYSPKYDSDGTVESTNIDNHYRYAEVPVDVRAPSGTYSFYFSHLGTSGTSTIKTIWFGRITLDNDGKRNPPVEDGYTLGGYSPPPPPGNTPPNDPPTSLGGGGGGGDVKPGPVITWMKKTIDGLIKAALSIIRGGKTSGQAELAAYPRLAVPAGTKGTVDYDDGTKAALLQTNEAAPHSGTLTVTVHVTSTKTGKTKSVKLPVITATQGQPTSISFSVIGKLLTALSAKGKIKVTFDNAFKPEGSKKTIRASTK